MKGETVTVWRKTEIGTDGMGEPEYTWTSEQVQNCLVRPYTGEDVTDTPHTQGVRVDYTVAFPKTYEGRDTLRGCKMSFRKITQDDALLVVGSPDITFPSPNAWDTLVKVGCVYG